MTSQRRSKVADNLSLASACADRQTEALDKAIELMHHARNNAALCREKVNEAIGLTAFSDWVRANPRLDSDMQGLSVQNLDWVFHQFREPHQVGNNRRHGICNLMIVEEKRFGADSGFAQRDTLSIVDQAIRSNRPRDSKGRPTTGGHRMVLNLRGERVALRYYGVFQLQFDGDGPLTSEKILWRQLPSGDAKAITIDHLEGLLRFEIDPRKLRPMEYRSHHRLPPQLPTLFDGVTNDPA